MAIGGGDGSIILTTKIDESGLNDGLKKLRGGILSFEKALKGVAVAGAGAFVAVGTAAIKTYADFEQLSGGVQKIFNEIDYSVIEKDAQEAFKTMQMSANQYLEVMTTVGANFASTLGDAKGYEVAKQGMKAITDFATGTGRSVDELSEKYQMITKSTSSYQSIADQFAGILPATSAGFLEQAQAAGFLSDSYTKLTEVPMAEYQEAVTQMLTKGVDALGLTNNAANEASTTLSGSFSMLQGSWSNLLTAFANPDQDMSVALDDFEDSLSAVADNLLPRVGEVASSIFGAIPTPILIAVGAIGSLAAGITAYNTVATISSAITAAKAAVEAGEATTLWGAVAAQIGLNTAMLASPITWVVAGIAALVAAFVILWNKSEGFRNFWIGLWEAIKTAVVPVIDWIKEAFSTAWDYIKGVWEQVQPFFAIIWEGIKAVFSVVGAVLGGFFSTAWAMIKAVWDTVTGYFSAIWDTIAGIFSVVASVLSGNWSDAWEAIKGIVNTWANFFSGVWGSIKSVFSAVGSWFKGIFSAAWNGIKNVWSAVGSFFSGIINTIKSIFQQLPSQLIAIGKNMIDGLWNGIKNAKNWLLGKIKKWCGSVLNGIKAFFGIHSPSTVMRDEVGKQIPAGMAIGIDKAKNLVTKATKALVTDTRSEVQKVLDDMNEEMLESEKLYAKESLRIEREKAEKEYKEKLKNAKNAKERQKIENERQEKLQEEANKAYLDGLKETAEKERKLYNARQKDIENAQKNIVNAYKNASDDILKSIEDLQKKQQSLSDKLFDFGDVMEDKAKDKFSDIHSPITEKDGRYVLENLGSQTLELERYLDLMTNLRDREGMSSELFDVIKNMSYEESFAYAKKLMTMGDKQFSKYIENWQKKQETSKRITEELFGDDGSMGAKRILSDLTDQTSVLKDYYSLLEQVKNRAELPDGFFDTLREMGIEEGLEYANALLELSDEDFANYIKAWEEKQKTSQLISKELYKEEAEQLANEIGVKFNEVEKEFFGVGENSACEFENGFKEQLKTVISNIKGAISSAFSDVGLGMTPNYGIGGCSINVPALARGSVLPGGKPFLAIVNDQPRGQTNVEAPLQTIVDAMNIALNNRGGSEIIREEHYNLNETELMTILHKLVKGGERLQGKSLISGGAY